jgi:hypothetical protein
MRLSGRMRSLEGVQDPWSTSKLGLLLGLTGIGLCMPRERRETGDWAMGGSNEDILPANPSLGPCAGRVGGHVGWTFMDADGVCLRGRRSGAIEASKSWCDVGNDPQQGAGVPVQSLPGPVAAKGG